MGRFDLDGRVGALALILTLVSACGGEPDALPRDDESAAESASVEESDLSARSPGGTGLPAAPPAYEFVQLTLPSGDPDAGRTAFAELRCASCHQVAGEADLPAPISTSAGPELGPELAPQPLGNLATAIVAPSHTMSMRTSPETREQVDGALSPMGDYSEVMTVRQLLDILAFLDSVRR